MPIFALMFVAGAWVLQQLPWLPSLSWGWCVLLVFPLWCLRQFPLTRYVATGLLGMMLGFGWAAWCAHGRMADQLPHAWEGRDIEIVGVVASLPAMHERGRRFDFAVEQVKTPHAVVPTNISLMQYSGDYVMDTVSATASNRSLPEFHAGERWQLTVRLKRPHSTANPHGYDFELWMLERNIRASGYIRQAPQPVMLSARVLKPQYMIERVREHISQYMMQALYGQPYAGVLRALAIGADDAVSQQDWQIFRRTGIVHLISISGVHITMLSAMAYALVYAIWCRIPYWVLYVPARKVALVAGVATAIAYALVAGFSVPTQRTLYMLSVFAVAFWSGRRVSFGRVLLFALLVVVLIDPWAVLAAGFWLSFGAVALIAYVMGKRIRRPHWFRDAILSQWAVTVGLMPGLLLLFGQFSLVSPLANAFAIPLVSLVIVPLTLLGSFLSVDVLLWLAHWIMQLAMQLLGWLSDLPAAVWQQHAPTTLSLLLAVGGIACLLLPRGIALRWLGLIAVLPIFFNKPDTPLPGEMRVAVLDVGQGLAVVIRTNQHTLLYDTGPRFSSESDSGNRVIVPYLHGEGIQRLHGMVVSHDDLDHTGGMDSVLAAIPVDWAIGSLPADKPVLRALNHRPCQAGQRWSWGGVTFEILYPANPDQFSSSVRTNNRSCVLRVRSAGGTLLLPGDIERSAEVDLLGMGAENFAAEVLLAPHHGSKTSSTHDFVTAVKPRIVIFTAGYLNRFRHPRPEIVKQYESLGARQYRSDDDGAVILDFSRDGGVVATSWREKSRRYWHDQSAAFTRASLAETGSAR
ncbi:competence protein ComEC [Methylobacillus rhizosphaerae]|uniref:Competence protein ComEC n=1 Tax=Methylobacillus rhizosphaerae TaxID=551994 RepID=A0A238Y6E8_9PROT|nr:DNA internalization-related competence protein ComEC/Rec2 [Methylobacillus rhizosphaerae]SNR66144.1 competence protein ComEC [Methylobacillus rhizosphaerae]